MARHEPICVAHTVRTEFEDGTPVLREIRTGVILDVGADLSPGMAQIARQREDNRIRAEEEQRYAEEHPWEFNPDYD